MKQYTLQEIRTRVEELGVECNLQLIEQWLHEGELTNMKIGPFYQIEEQDGFRGFRLPLPVARYSL